VISHGEKRAGDQAHTILLNALVEPFFTAALSGLWALAGFAAGTAALDR
jgi:hypothetical protein